jgi:hypothetical protein
LFEELLRGHFANIDKTQISGLRRIASLLGEYEIEGEIIEFELEGEDITISNIGTRIEKKTSHSRDMSDEMKFVIQHIDEIGLKACRDLGVIFWKLY